jgi:hypothetical protein
VSVFLEQQRTTWPRWGVSRSGARIAHAFDGPAAGDLVCGTFAPTDVADWIEDPPRRCRVCSEKLARRTTAGAIEAGRAAAARTKAAVAAVLDRLDERFAPTPELLSVAEAAFMHELTGAGLRDAASALDDTRLLGAVIEAWKAEIRRR